ncbi:phytanoyl-CoA dioxygenase family protein [Streptomyces avicenniae]|uniref:phytanoyl-CoA dioxygenase family protein n=1 Tax=Streptomyces avicenniae TaxID=500153 RepID=UPI00069AD8A4|nr:phytanoyl-CoA dioxygenase family protein [Streptomyces avicenniae]
MQDRDLLTSRQIEDYRRTGFLFQPGALEASDIELLRSEAEKELSQDSPRRTVEAATGLPYRVHGSHLHNDVFSQFVRTPQMLGVARQLLNEDVYVHQFKINKKRAFQGEIWRWHQDFMFWHNEDQMPEPRALTVGVFLDEVTEFNGPLIVVPGGHAEGLINTPPQTEGWESTLTNKLKYSLEDSEEMQALVDQHGLVAPKGPRGSLLWFHCSIPHGSAQNMSPIDRSLLLLSYNAVSNALPAPSPRPEWLVGRDFSPLEPLEGSLTAPSRG